jgi:hypothetical protein
VSTSLRRAALERWLERAGEVVEDQLSNELESVSSPSAPVASPLFGGHRRGCSTSETVAALWARPPRDYDTGVKEEVRAGAPGAPDAA